MMRNLVLLLLVSIGAQAQQIANVKAEAQGPIITITYDLTAADPDDTYNISVTSSASNFKATLMKVSGDVGKNVKPGPGKRIIWQAQTELGSFKGDIFFEVQGEVVAALAFSQPPAAVKRGTNKVITWRGGDYKQDVKIELLQGASASAPIGTVANKGTFTWSIPSDQKPGDYQIRLTNGKETVTHSVAIKHKVPTLLKVVPVVAAGAAVVLLTGGTSPTGGPGDTSNALATPPDILD